MIWKITDVLPAPVGPTNSAFACGSANRSAPLTFCIGWPAPDIGIGITFWSLILLPFGLWSFVSNAAAIAVYHTKKEISK